MRRLCCSHCSARPNDGRIEAVSGRLQCPSERQQWVDSRPSLCALEPPLSRRKVTFARQVSLDPQQLLSVTIPQRALLLVASVVTGGGIK